MPILKLSPTNTLIPVTELAHSIVTTFAYNCVKDLIPQTELAQKVASIASLIFIVFFNIGKTPLIKVLLLMDFAIILIRHTPLTTKIQESILNPMESASKLSGVDIRRTTA